MAMYKADRIFKRGPKKRTSIGNGLRKRGTKSQRKQYRGQGKR